jgi:hypothetical protein
MGGVLGRHAERLAEGGGGEERPGDRGACGEPAALDHGEERPSIFGLRGEYREKFPIQASLAQGRLGFQRPSPVISGQGSAVIPAAPVGGERDAERRRFAALERELEERAVRSVRAWVSEPPAPHPQRRTDRGAQALCRAGRTPGRSAQRGRRCRMLIENPLDSPDRLVG